MLVCLITIVPIIIAMIIIIITIVRIMVNDHWSLSSPWSFPSPSSPSALTLAQNTSPSQAGPTCRRLPTPSWRAHTKVPGRGWSATPFQGDPNYCHMILTTGQWPAEPFQRDQNNQRNDTDADQNSCLNDTDQSMCGKGRVPIFCQGSFCWQRCILAPTWEIDHLKWVNHKLDQIELERSASWQCETLSLDPLSTMSMSMSGRGCVALGGGMKIWHWRRMIFCCVQAYIHTLRYHCRPKNVDDKYSKIFLSLKWNEKLRDSTRSPYRGYREVATISSDVFDKVFWYRNIYNYYLHRFSIIISSCSSQQ